MTFHPRLSQQIIFGPVCDPAVRSARGTKRRTPRHIHCTFAEEEEEEESTTTSLPEGIQLEEEAVQAEEELEEGAGAGRRDCKNNFCCTPWAVGLRCRRR